MIAILQYRQLGMHYDTVNIMHKNFELFFSDLWKDDSSRYLCPFQYFCREDSCHSRFLSPKSSSAITSDISSSKDAYILTVIMLSFSCFSFVIPSCQNSVISSFFSFFFLFDIILVCNMYCRFGLLNSTIHFYF